MSLGVFSKDRLIFDATEADQSDNVGAYLRSSDGSLITDHEIVEAEYAGLVAQGLIFKSKLPGAIGNTYSFQVVNTTPGVLSFTELGGAIVVDLHNTTSTTAQVATLLAASTYASVTVGTPTGNVIVAAVQSFANGEDSAVHKHLDVYSATADGAGNPITSTGGALDINVKSGALTVDINGIYNVGTNPTPDNVGIIGSSRAVAGLANQTLQFTGGGVGSDAIDPANIVAQDANAFGMMWDSIAGKWQRIPGTLAGGQLVKISNTSLSVTQGTTPWQVSGDVADDAADAGDPVKVGSRSEWGALGALSNDGDRADLVSDKYRRLYINSGSNVAVRNLNVTVGAVELELKSGATALEGRRLLMIQNLSNKEIYVGKTGVLATTGLVLAARATISLDVGQDVAVFALGSGTNQDVRVFELA